MVASVPELTIRTISTEGIRSMTNAAISVSSSVGSQSLCHVATFVGRIQRRQDVHVQGSKGPMNRCNQCIHCHRDRLPSNPFLHLIKIGSTSTARKCTNRTIDSSWNVLHCFLVCQDRLSILQRLQPFYLFSFMIQLN